MKKCPMKIIKKKLKRADTRLTSSKTINTFITFKVTFLPLLWSNTYHLSINHFIRNWIKKEPHKYNKKEVTVAKDIKKVATKKGNEKWILRGFDWHCIVSFNCLLRVWWSAACIQSAKPEQQSWEKHSKASSSMKHTN